LRTVNTLLTVFGARLVSACFKRAAMLGLDPKTVQHYLKVASDACVRSGGCRRLTMSPT
jgi:hypothetical protein